MTTQAPPEGTGTAGVFAALTSLETALALLLEKLEPVGAVDLALDLSLGAVAAEALPVAQGLPVADEATADGFAFSAADLVGASSYSPVAFFTEPRRVEVGCPMPGGCDCVLDASLVECRDGLVEAMAEAFPGQGMRRAGDDLRVGGSATTPGRRVSPIDLLIARRLGRTSLPVRRPRVAIVNVGNDRHGPSAAFVADFAASEGAAIAAIAMTPRDLAAIGAAIDRVLADGCDLLVLVGGTGRGAKDHTVAALKSRAETLRHGVALRPGGSAAVGRIAGLPVIALPGTPGEAVAATLALLRPVLDRLSGRRQRLTSTLPLAGKIASSGGLAELVLLQHQGAALAPIATGTFSLESLGRADAFLIVPGASEGFAAGMAVEAFALFEAV
ncbi:molybdopterin-binding protein [Aureimonas sp. SA4125]|uniref:molybdopterin-binding protein n=1 Tax=Aureimonas sp. SA4125 TaxID=2826993 RepID=UPI001CC34176|nr:molybdopterin-binding protein [Aureimonas sp. SA4125]BDA84151.1 molybdopterin-binding protein [Aureimonas sp. SA4125]